LNGILKTTKTVTSDYVESTSQNSITLNDVTDIAVGDILNIVSTELYDTSRLYYFKGGNVIVTSIVGNTVYFNMTLPLDMSASSITVKVYSPIEVQLKNIKKLIGKLSLDSSVSGIEIAYAKNSSMENIKTTGFQSNITIKRCINTLLSNIDTGNAKNSTNDSWNGYGVLVYSSTNITLFKIVTNSGQHGITTGGQEVNYNIVFDSCVLNAEVWGLGLGLHANIYNSSFTNCTFSGLSLYGNVNMFSCREIGSTVEPTRENILFSSESYKNANYYFNSCSFSRDINVLDYYQEICPTRKYIGTISFHNCSEVRFHSYVNQQSNGYKIADIDKVILNNCNDFVTVFTDKHNNIIVKDSNTEIDSAEIIQVSVNAAYQKINNVLIDNIKIPKRYNAIDIHLAGNVDIRNVSYNNVDYGDAQETYSNIDKLSMYNVDNTNAQRGISFGSIGEARIFNSDILLFDNLSNNIANITRAEIRTSKIKGEYMEVVTTTDNKKYKQTIDTNGNTVSDLIS